MQKEIGVSTSKREELVDITSQVKKVVAESKVKEGTCNVYVPHATASIIINENWDPNINEDFLSCLSSLVPSGKWLHDRVDGNGDAHIKAAIVGPSETLIIEKGELVRAGKGNVSYGYKGKSKHQNIEKSNVSSWSQNFVKDNLIPGMAYERKTIGYTKCNCNAEWLGAICLDIFAGSGTTFVALKKFKPKAKWIGFEINKDYIKIAEKRLAQKNLIELKVIK